MAARPRVVVVGAGFAGLWAARALAEHPVHVTLVDRNNFHTFFPLLYQVAAAELVPTDIAFPVRAMFRDSPSVQVRLAEVEGVDPGTRRVRLSDGGVLSYDALVLALGSEPHYFGTPGAEEHAFPLRRMDQAIPLRHHILTRFEEAVGEADAARRRRLLTFAVVGGGPTGVEFAGALAELIHGPLLKDFPDLSPDEVSVLLLKALDGVLQGMDPRLGSYARDRLERRHVEVRLGVKVAEVRPDAVVLDGGAELATETVVWTAGVRGTPRVEAWGLPTARGGRVAVTPALNLEAHPDLFVAGDLAYQEDAAGEPLPQVAPVAMQQGEHAARNVLAHLRGKPLEPFVYDDPGLLAVIGRYAAVAEVFGRSFTGFFAWVLWALVHVAKLIGFRNRASVLVNWAWNYLSYQSAVRLILTDVDHRRDESMERKDAPSSSGPAAS